MKKIILPIIALLTVIATATAETEIMRIHLSDGSSVDYRISDVERITFAESVPVATISVSGITLNSATFTVEPNYTVDSYTFGVVKKADYESFASEAEFIGGEIEKLRSEAAEWGFSFEEYLDFVLYRSSEKAGILDYCKENGIDFWAYMVLEQGALSGKYDTQHPLPAGSQRGETYNPMLPQIEKLVTVMRGIGEKYGVSPAQVALAWAIAKGTTPIIGVTKVPQVQDAVKAMRISLTIEEINQMEMVAEETGVDTRGSWEMPMI